jgi:hypothetical protein
MNKKIKNNSNIKQPNQIKIFLKDLHTKEIKKIIPCDDMQQAKILLQHIDYDRKKFFNEIEEKIFFNGEVITRILK